MAKNQAVWPSLEQQLTDAKAASGSELERLIRENQNFEMLRPEEANDRLGYPPWLRVYWRKAHPEGAYSGRDATGGYPQMLHRIYGWMLKHQDLRSK